jgi:protoporphyrinogen oxidase
MSDQSLIIVGGGITGLSAAYIAARQGRQVTVIEGGKQFGGLLSTFPIAGNQLEHYYHHFFTHDAEIMWLLRELGLADELHFKTTSMGVFRNGKIYPFNSPKDLLTFSPINLVDKVRFGLTSLYLGKSADWRKYEEVPCMDWFYRYAGKSTTDSLWAPMLKIKFGPYAPKVPLSWMIGRLKQRLNSRKQGDEKLGYLDGSLQRLLDKLLEALRDMGVQLISEAPVTSIALRENQMAAVTTPKGEFTGEQFLFTIPGTVMSGLFESALPALSKKIAAIEYFGAVCVILEMDRALSDVYWLNIADEGFPFGGVIEHTNFIGPEHYSGSHIAYLSRYFAHSEDIAKMSAEEIRERMLRQLPRIYPDFKPEHLRNVFVFRTNTAATVCDLGFSQKVPDCRTEIGNLFIANMSHVYPDERSTNNSIRIAAEACRVMGIPSAHVPKNNSMSGQIGF